MSAERRGSTAGEVGEAADAADITEFLGWRATAERYGRPSKNGPLRPSQLRYGDVTGVNEKSPLGRAPFGCIDPRGLRRRAGTMGRRIVSEFPARRSRRPKRDHGC